MSYRSGGNGQSTRVVIFTGPSLHPSEAAALLDAEFLPPIKRGDLGLLNDRKPSIVGIIDGEFYQSLAVTIKEVLAQLDGGIAIYGAASMGALRAVELSRYGMIGVGSVFRLFRKGVLDADDEVALAYSRETCRAVSDPLVNTRYALRAAVRLGILNRAEANEVVRALKAVYFPDRTRQLILSIASKAIGRERTHQLRDVLNDSAYDIKRRDAQSLLKRIRRDVGSPGDHLPALGVRASFVR